MTRSKIVDLPHDAYEWYEVKRIDGKVYFFWYCRLVDRKWFVNRKLRPEE